MTRRLPLLVALALLLFGAVVFMRTANVGTAALWSWSDEGQWLLPLVVVAALIDSINPCAFSILLVTIAFLFSVGKQRSGVLELGSSYILGIFVVYALIGLGLLQAMHLFHTPHFMGKVGAVLLVGLGLLAIVQHYRPSFPVRFGVPKAMHERIAVLMEKSSVPSAFGLGALVGLCEFPCTGGPYVMVIGLLHDQGTWSTGLAYLFLYNAVFVLPLVVILLIASDKALIDKVREWKARENSRMRLAGGLSMVGLGAVIFAM
jgi:cytochrome c biogenesis protein CcdA